MSDTAPSVTSLPTPPAAGSRQAGFNATHSTTYRGGWIGLFAGENQTKALNRAISELNAQGRCVAAAVVDRWSFWKRLGVMLLAIVTLGFVVRVPNVVLVSAPLN